MITNPRIVRMKDGSTKPGYVILQDREAVTTKAPAMLGLYPTWKDAHNALLAECQRGVRAAQDALNSALAVRVKVQWMEEPSDD